MPHKAKDTRQIRLKNALNKLNMRNQKRDRKTCNAGAGLEKYAANPYSLLPQLLRAGQQNIINSFQLAVRGALTKVFRREHTASHYAVQGGRKTAKSDITSIRENNRRRIRGRTKRIAVKRVDIVVPKSQLFQKSLRKTKSVVPRDSIARYICLVILDDEKWLPLPRLQKL